MDKLTIREIRKEMGLTIAQMAGALGWGFDYYRNRERYDVVAYVTDAQMLCTLSGLEFNQIIWSKEELEQTTTIGGN